MNKSIRAIISCFSAGVVIALSGNAYAANTNSTVQEGRVNINITRQCDDTNDNVTYQTGKVNINRTVQGCPGSRANKGPAGQAGAKRALPAVQQASRKSAKLAERRERERAVERANNEVDN